MKALKIAKALILVCVLIGLSYYSYIEIEKFIEKKTTISIYNQPNETLELPLITICANPPLKGDFFTPTIAYETLDMSPIERINLSEKWDEEVSMSNVSIQTMTRPHAQINVEEVQTIQSGRCYIVDDQPPYKAFHVSFGDESSAPSELSVYVHPRSER